MPAGFEEFTRAAARAAAPAPYREEPLERLAVLGGGADGRLLAALGLAHEAKVTLFSAYRAEIDPILEAGGISLRGAGPVGHYRAARNSEPTFPSISLCTEIDSAVKDAQVIFITGPVHKQRTFSMVLAEHVKDGQILVLLPGRTFGAIECAWLLKLGGCRADITIVERQGPAWWHLAQGSALFLTPTRAMPAGCLPRGRERVIASLSPFIGDSISMDDALASSFADLSAAIEIPALCLSGIGLRPGGPEIPPGAKALPENRTFANLIGADQQTLIDRLKAERRRVARAFGIRTLPDDGPWQTLFAGEAGGEGRRPVPDLAQARRLMRDGVIASLSPLVFAAERTNIDVPVTRALIAMTEAMLEANVAIAGRRLDMIGTESKSVEEIRRSVDTLLTGEV
ncbi:hypothetical protein [Thioalkalivibrio sp. HK1]|uniref:hypothetical protein n=1 Tax=Thioalkalivibrio sp. HK1 TaxID=1469245 RepID=UPI00046FF939|nr:hypothetical protein [Thioalkalivibrio sp. HK1]